MLIYIYQISNYYGRGSNRGVRGGRGGGRGGGMRGRGNWRGRGNRGGGGEPQPQRGPQGIGGINREQRRAIGRILNRDLAVEEQRMLQRALMDVLKRSSNNVQQEQQQAQQQEQPPEQQPAPQEQQPAPQEQQN